MYWDAILVLGSNRDHGEAPLGHSARDIDCGRFLYEPQKVSFDTMSSAHTSWVCVGFEGGVFKGPSRKIEGGGKRVGKVGYPPTNDPPEKWQPF